MKIAVLSGKGGTGKTTVSVNLFSRMKDATLIDTDVEEPNSHLFINHEVESFEDVYKKYPIVDESKCVLCGACGNFCKFNAILPTKKKVIVFEDLCHDCGGCKLTCKYDAITYQKKSIGKIIHTKTSKNKSFLYGNLNVGEVSGISLIAQLRYLTEHDDLVIIDSPPGTACSTVAAVSDVDYAIVVTEPTPFGLSDMMMVVELLREEKINFGVVINKAHLGTNDIYEYLDREHIDLITEIPFDKKYAKLYSTGKIISDYSQDFATSIDKIIDHLKAVNI